MSKMSSDIATINKEGIKLSNAVPKLFGIGLALLALAGVVKIIGNLDPEKAKQGFIGLTAMVVEMGVFLAAYFLLV